MEAWVEERWVVADPTVGWLFTRPDGKGATVEDLENGDLLASQAGGTYDLEIAKFQEVRRVRWSKFPFGEWIYGMVKRLCGKPFADGVAYPYWAERPSLMFAGLFTFAGFGLAVMFLLVRVRDC